METSKRSILIVDDNRTFVMYIGVLLRRMGFEVFAAGNGMEGLKLLKLSPPDLLLLDIIMPDMDGMTLLRHVKGDPQLAKIPVVMVSVDASSETRQKSVKLGCSGFLAKPITLEHLHHVLYDFLPFPTGKREFLRAPVNERISVECNGVREELYAGSLSQGGIYLRRRDPYPVGSEVILRLSLWSGPSIAVSGTVIYVREPFGTAFSIDPGMAIRFHELGERDSRALKAYITEQLAGDILTEQQEPVLRNEEEV